MKNMSLSPLTPASDWTLWLAIGGGVLGLLLLIIVAVVIYRRSRKGISDVQIYQAAGPVPPPYVAEPYAITKLQPLV